MEKHDSQFADARIFKADFAAKISGGGDFSHSQKQVKYAASISHSEPPTAKCP